MSAEVAEAAKVSVVSGAADVERAVAVLADDAQVLAAARALAAAVADGAAERDAARELPAAGVARLSESGLLGATVPARFGGAEVGAATLAEVFVVLAQADPSLAQIPHSHFTFLEALRLQGNESQQRHFYGLVLDGALLANAQSERGPHTVDVDTTTLIEVPGDRYVLAGRKFYATGSLFADWLVVRASLTDGRETPTASTPKAVAFVPRDAAGVEVLDDWDGMGQRTTASGTVVLDGVDVPAAHVVPFTPIFAAPTVYGARAQLLHAAIDAGIAVGSLDAGVRAAGRARPHFEAGVAEATADPTLRHVAGEATVTVRAARALLGEAARAVDAAAADPTDDSTAAASIAVAIAKVAAARAALDASTVLFELGGTRSASASGNLARFWRDARTHTLHDPTRWKLQHIGDYVLTGAHPPRHGQL